LTVLGVVSLAFVVLMLIIIRGASGPPWLIAPLLLGPRWPWLAPSAAVGLLALIFRRWKVLGLSLLGLAIVAGPIMDFHIPWYRYLQPKPQGQVVRIMTFNGVKYNAEVLRKVVTQERIDVLCFQELAMDDKLDEFLRGGWHISRSGKVASRFPILEEYPGMVQQSLDAGRYVGEFTRVRVKLPSGREVLLASVHLPTVRPGLERMLEKKVDGIEMIWPWWDRQMGRVIDDLTQQRNLPFLAGGDWNMPREHPKFRSYGNLFSIAFEEAGFGYGYTRPARRSWVKIDHVLGSSHWVFNRCWVGPDMGSDHLPVIAEAVLLNGSEKAQ